MNSNNTSNNFSNTGGPAQANPVYRSLNGSLRNNLNSAGNSGSGTSLNMRSSNNNNNTVAANALWFINKKIRNVIQQQPINIKTNLIVCNNWLVFIILYIF